MTRQPGIYLVTDGPRVDEALAATLCSRYKGGYQVHIAASEAEAEQALIEGKDHSQPVALFIYDQVSAGLRGADFLKRSQHLYQEAKCVLLTDYPDAETAIVSINRPYINYYLVKPWEPAEETLFPVVDDLLADWQASVQLPFMRVKGVMTVRAVRIREDESILRAAEIVALSGVTDLMVVDAEGGFVGVLSVGDILRAAMPDVDEITGEGGSLDLAFQLFLRKGIDLSTKSIQPLIIREPIVVDPEDHVAKVATVLLDKGIGRLPVLKDGRLVGTVSRADICQAIVGVL